MPSQGGYFLHSGIFPYIKYTLYTHINNYHIDVYKYTCTYIYMYIYIYLNVCPVRVATFCIVGYFHMITWFSENPCVDTIDNYICI
jgi:hypothetical protein